MTNLPAKRGSENAVLDRIRSAKPKQPIATTSSKASMVAAATAARTPRLVFAIDATASREPAWDASRQATDALFQALPGALEVALAVHSGSRVTMFSDFSTDVANFRRTAQTVNCEAGTTRLVDLMQQTRTHAGVKVFLYIGDCFEEDRQTAIDAAQAFKARGIKAVMFYDPISNDASARSVFEEIARITGGACLEFGQRTDDLRQIFEAVAVLAAGGVQLLKREQHRLPGAARLLIGMNE